MWILIILMNLTVFIILHISVHNFSPKCELKLAITSGYYFIRKAFDLEMTVSESADTLSGGVN